MVHSVVCGPIESETLGGSRYFLTFIDEFTRKIWFYLLKEKSKVFSMIKKFCALVERQSGNKMKPLRTYGGGEFKSNAFKNFSEKKGISHEVTAPYTPQHNGIEERRNRTLLDMERGMMKGKKMTKRYWGEAVNTTGYVLNRCPTRSLADMTPEQAWVHYKKTGH